MFFGVCGRRRGIAQFLVVLRGEQSSFGGESLLYLYSGSSCICVHVQGHEIGICFELKKTAYCHGIALSIVSHSYVQLLV